MMDLSKQEDQKQERLVLDSLMIRPSHKQAIQDLAITLSAKHGYKVSKSELYRLGIDMILDHYNVLPK